MGRGRPITLSDDDLLDAAQAVFLEKGLDATTAQVAQRASISESVIFHRWGTKETLLHAVLERQMTVAPELQGLCDLAGKGRIADHLNRTGLAIIEKMRTALPFFMLAFSSPMKLNNLNERVREIHPVYVQKLSEYLGEEARLGRLAGADPEILAHAFFGGLREYVFFELFASDEGSLTTDAAEYVRGLTDVLMGGATRRKPSR